MARYNFFADRLLSLTPAQVTDRKEYEKILVGKVPIMLRSRYCLLVNMSTTELAFMNECPIDVGGYFVINGSEKVCS
jgi:DNA-directed RNA polymerase II subunit RPB2